MNTLPFNPNHLPDVPTAVYDDSGSLIGTFNPHTCIIHPSADSDFGALKLLGKLAFDMQGKLVGKFNDDGQLVATPDPATA
ncbi:MAG: hypothetical protein AAFR81_13575 [Chloroflexota bacterium]